MERQNGYSPIPNITLPYWEEGKVLVLDGNDLVKRAKRAIRRGVPEMVLYSRDTRDDDSIAAGILGDFFNGIPTVAGRVRVTPDQDLGGYLRIERINGYGLRARLKDLFKLGR